MKSDAPERFAALDLLRGVAALAVLVFHLPWPNGVRPPLPRAYLAVDLFFLLSGFVIAHAYEHRLGTTAQLKQFFVARLIRLYPLYLAATLISAGLLFLAAAFGSGTYPAVTVPNVAKSLGTALFMLPTPRSWSSDPTYFFPLVFTAWSLMSEIWVNLLYAVLAPRLGRALLAAFIGAGLVGIALLLHSYGELRAGWAWDGAWGGPARALFSFFVGVGLFRLRQRRRAPRIPAVLLAVALIVALVPKTFGGAYELICVILLFPLLVWLGAEATMGRRSEALGSLAGYLSYPIYLLQTSFLLILGPLWLRLARIMPTDDWIKLTTYAVVVLIGSWVVARWYDTPVRDTLRHRFARRAPRPAAETAP